MDSRYTPTSPLSPKLSGNNRPMSPQPGVQRAGQMRKQSRNLNMALPRYQPSDFNQSSGGATASPRIQSPTLTLNLSTQPMQLDSARVMREKHQEFLDSVRLSAKFAASPFCQKPRSPRLDPLGSPKGPVTPLALEEGTGYFGPAGPAATPVKRTTVDGSGGRSPHRTRPTSRDGGVGQQKDKVDIY
ncbi:hypothetical protein DV735_g3928, partial [Chaetothyriales sp. CBS 134920]